MIDRANVTNVKHAFTTFEGGQFSICIRNIGNDLSNKVDFTMKHGIAAKDYSEIAKKKDLKPVELNVIININLSFKNLMIKRESLCIY